MAVRVTSNYAIPDYFKAADEYEMTVAYRDEWHDFYEVIFSPRDLRIKYLFVLQSDELTFKLDATGLKGGRGRGGGCEPGLRLCLCLSCGTPCPNGRGAAWAIRFFPDRFRREPVETDTEPVEPWTSTRVQNQYRFGGNLRGILKAVPYLRDLGVKMIYTTPLFLSDSSHRYNTFDYFKIDPLLGTEDDLRALCDELHKNDMRIVLDGVFNHCGLQFAPFADAMEKGEASPYRDWFFFDEKMPYGYHTFGDWRYMPKLNLAQRGLCAVFPVRGPLLAGKMPCGRMAAGCEPGGLAGLLAGSSGR